MVWTVEALALYTDQRFKDSLESFNRQLAALVLMLQERYESQTKDVDKAFAAAALAMKEAELAATKRSDQLLEKFTTELERVVARVSTLETHEDRSSGQDLGSSAVITRLISIGGVLIALAAVIVSIILR